MLPPAAPPPIRPSAPAPAPRCPAAAVTPRENLAAVHASPEVSVTEPLPRTCAAQPGIFSPTSRLVSHRSAPERTAQSADPGIDTHIQPRRLARQDCHRAREVARRIDAVAVQLDTIAAWREFNSVGAVGLKSDALDFCAAVDGVDHQSPTGTRGWWRCRRGYTDTVDRLEWADAGAAFEVSRLSHVRRDGWTAHGRLDTDAAGGHEQDTHEGRATNQAAIA